MAILLLRRRGGYTQAGGETPAARRAERSEALRSARHMIRAAVRAWGGREQSDEIELAADELITNALLHTDGGAVVTLRMLTGPERRLRVEVEDRSSVLPRRRETGEDGINGRGLLLVDRLAEAWGVESRGSGKCVWCEFVLPERTAACTGQSARGGEDPADGGDGGSPDTPQARRTAAAGG